MITRRRLVAYVAAGGSGIPFLRRPGDAAEFSFKLATTEPVTHPTNVRALEAAAQVKRESNGRLDISVFPEGSLGSPPQVISQLRLGAIQMHIPSLLVFANVVPVLAVDGLPFIYSGYQQAWRARDGQLGAYMRAAVDKLDLHTFETSWDDGCGTSSTTSGLSPNPTICGACGCGSAGRSCSRPSRRSAHRRRRWISTKSTPHCRRTSSTERSSRSA